MKKLVVSALCLTLILTLLTGCAPSRLMLSEIEYNTVQVTEGSSGAVAAPNEEQTAYLLSTLYKPVFERRDKADDATGWNYRVDFVDEGGIITSVTVLSDSRVAYDGYIYESSTPLDLEVLYRLFHAESPYNSLAVPDGVTMESREERYPFDARELLFTVKNEGDEAYVYGEDFALERLEGDKWISVTPEKELAWHAIGIILGPRSSADVKVPVDAFGPALPAGRYRVVKSIYPQGGQTSVLYGLIAEFDIEGPSLSRYSPPDGEIYIELESKRVAPGDTLYYTVYNKTGEEYGIVFIPYLERKVGEEWERVECDVGFCGITDPLTDSIESRLPLDFWFPGTEAGQYRFSLSVFDKNGKKTTIYETFEIV